MSNARERVHVYVQYVCTRAGMAAHTSYVCKLSSPVRNLAESINKFVVLQTRFVCKARRFFSLSVSPFLSFFRLPVYLYHIRDTRASSRKNKQDEKRYHRYARLLNTKELEIRISIKNNIGNEKNNNIIIHS